MNRRKTGDAGVRLFVVVVGIGLPLLGVMLAGEAVGKYTEFPPLTRYVQHAGFSWPVFIGLTAMILVVVTPFVVRVSFSCRQIANRKSPRQLRQVATWAKGPTWQIANSFPWWGWVGVSLGIIAWVLAWTRLAWFAPLQHFTFSPLWFAYILVVNALSYMRTGRCMLVNRRRFFVLLFLLSAAFWWFFEYLNRFVQNWHYTGIADLTPLQYFIFATLPFSTVLPAVLGTYELLESVPSAGAGLDRFLKIEIAYAKIVAWGVLVVSCAGLGGLGVWPDYLFPLLWISPLLIITSLQAIRGKTTIFSPIRRGDWRRIYLLAMAALICGFFWEMWNYFSLAKWAYTVPFVGRFRIFEMPVLGFAGYLPFGLECAVIADLVFSRGEK